MQYELGPAEAPSRLNISPWEEVSNLAEQQNQKGQYKCNECGQKFQTQSELRQHETLEHNSEQQTRTAGGQSRNE